MESAGLDLALMVFEHTEGAERAFSSLPAEVDGIPWTREVAFVEHHGRDRIIVRGTFAGHYVDADDDEQFIGAGTAEGAIAGAAAGILLGPAALAVGIVGGGLAGSIADEHSGPKLRSALFDVVRNEVPQGSSAVIMLAAPEHVDAMGRALNGHGGRLARHQLSPQATQALQEAVASSPAAAPAT
jgi:uncharacterized membrane protein